MMRRSLFALLFALFLAPVCLGQANGKLKIHFIDVGQGDGALLVSPLGETILFDDGVMNNCDKPISYLQQLGVTKIDYHITSHYHSDHIGCAAQVLQEFPLKKDALDRGGNYHTGTYTAYAVAVGTHRKTATAGMTITLDASSANPVTIKVITLNGNGVSTDNENDLSLLAMVSFGSFDALIGGDLSGFKTDNYEDIESTVVPLVKQVEVYKVHHHGSRYSSNKNWMQKIRPLVGVISTGDGNRYGHPTPECLERLHAANVKTYWTERGAGADPEPGWDTVGGNIVVESAPGNSQFTVTHNGSQVDTYNNWEGSVGPAPSPDTIPKFAWSKKSEVYHHINCKYVDNIILDNLQKGSTPPHWQTPTYRMPEVSTVKEAKASRCRLILALPQR